MKTQIRRGVFETNSSSTHSLTLILKSDYDKWEKENGFFLYTGCGWGYPENNKPQTDHVYTKEEAIAFEKLNKYTPDDFDWNDEDEVMERLHDHEWYDSEYFWDCYCSEYETFEDTITTPSGDAIVAFGYYGYC